MVVMPRGAPESDLTARIANNGLSRSERSPQYKAGCALKIWSPLPIKTNRQTTFSQWLNRTGTLCR
jgi:hypothetical protein